MGLIISDAKREEGFTLIELLVVVIIIGILAAIAIPVFLNQRERAWQAAVESDLRNAAIEIETYYTANLSYPTLAIADGVLTFTIADGDDITVASSPGVDFFDSSGGGTAQGFCISAEHESSAGTDGTRTRYDSEGGGILRGAQCGS